MAVQVSTRAALCQCARPLGEVVETYLSLERVRVTGSKPRTSTVETETKARGLNERDYPAEVTVGGSNNARHEKCVSRDAGEA